MAAKNKAPAKSAAVSQAQAEDAIKLLLRWAGERRHLAACMNDVLRASTSLGPARPAPPPQWPDIVMCTPQTGRAWSGKCKIGKQLRKPCFHRFQMSKDTKEKVFS
mgnify:CR=1 FL=1